MFRFDPALKVYLHRSLWTAGIGLAGEYVLPAIFGHSSTPVFGEQDVSNNTHI